MPWLINLSSQIAYHFHYSKIWAISFTLGGMKYEWIESKKGEPYIQIRWSIHLKNVQINALCFVEVYIEHLGVKCKKLLTHQQQWVLGTFQFICCDWNWQKMNGCVVVVVLKHREWGTNATLLIIFRILQKPKLGRILYDCIRNVTRLPKLSFKCRKNLTTNRRI